MARYIDAEKFAKRIELSPAFENAAFAGDLLQRVVLDLLDNAPTADVVEVKHGYWIEKEEIYGDVYYTCSNCNNDWTTIDGTPQENFMTYCPNCGAKMDSQ